MWIEKIGLHNFDSYISFRRNMWPTHDSAGHWEIALEKYVFNPHASLCPGTGLYACFEGGNIRGIAGAYPMPITYSGELYPGHMLVDWAVLPEREHPENIKSVWSKKLYAAKLFEFVMALPGLKFGSYGTRFSQAPLERASTRIPACQAAALIMPARAALLEALRLRRSAQPSPLAAMPLYVLNRARSISPDDLPNTPPPNLDGTAHVWRDVAFWRQYFNCRSCNGAFALLIEHGREIGYAVLNLLEVGRFRFANLLLLHIVDPHPRSAYQLGLSARRALQELGVCFVLATDSDDVVHFFLNGAGTYVVRRPTVWWRIPRPSDSLPVEGIPWHFTSADRDGIWWPGQQTPEVEEHSRLPRQTTRRERSIATAAHN